MIPGAPPELTQRLPLPPLPPRAPVPPRKLEQQNAPTSPLPEPVGESAMGFPVYNRLVLLPVSYENKRGEQVRTEQVDLEIKSVSYGSQRNIVRTATEQEVVVELSSSGQDTLTISAYCLAANTWEFAAEKLQAITQALSAPVPLPIANPGMDLENWGVSRLLVTNWRVGEMNGARNVRIITINAIPEFE